MWEEEAVELRECLQDLRGWRGSAVCTSATGAGRLSRCSSHAHHEYYATTTNPISGSISFGLRVAGRSPGASKSAAQPQCRLHTLPAGLAESVMQSFSRVSDFTPNSGDRL